MSTGEIDVIFVVANRATAAEERRTVKAKVGSSILEVAQQNDLDLEGACEGSLACSTCHVVLDQATYDSLPEPSDEENDMLDLAFGVKKTSRLGCQIIIKPHMQGANIEIPAKTRNIR